MRFSLYLIIFTVIFSRESYATACLKLNLSNTLAEYRFGDDLADGQLFISKSKMSRGTVREAYEMVMRHFELNGGTSPSKMSVIYQEDQSTIHWIINKGEIYKSTARGIDQLTPYYPNNLLEKNLTLHKKILDIGAGGGDFVNDLVEQGYKVKGVDLIDNFKHRELVDEGILKVGDYTDPNLFRDEKFDIITANYSIFRLNDFHNVFFKEGVFALKNKLNLGGKIFLSPVNLENKKLMSKFIDLIKDNPEFGIKVHKLNVTKKYKGQVFKDLSTVEISYIGDYN